ncbi:MAG TPA: TIGR03087 family PEP-CTERM/XrtA system glycosyltransferase [Planctomycetota bacterium]|nr:TIGR03087 family PEP-CTERM/XrtA system glycosyltransferase [Planctomycetota bacterium]
MRVLFLAQRVPYPPDRGDRITTHHFLRHLLARGARVRVGCFAEDAVDLDAAAVLRRDVEAVCAPRVSRRVRRFTSLRGLLRGQPLTLPFFAHRGLARTLAEWTRRDPPDLVWVYSSGMAQFALALPPAPVRLMQFAELDSDKWRQFAERSRGIARAIYAREARLLLEFERTVARAFTISTVVSEVERDLFRAHIPDVDPLVLPNGVDVDRFRPGDDARREPHAAIFTGVMDYEPNVDGITWFVVHAWPKVRARVPDARLFVVGSRPVAAVRALHGKDGVEVTGRVPEVPPWLDRAAVAVAPLRLARGVQNKVLEAMSAGLPVVATPAAAQGLGAASAGHDGLLVADDADAIARHVGDLMLDPAQARRRGAAAAAFVRAAFRWEHMFAIADRAIDEALARARSAEPRPTGHPHGGAAAR